MARALTTVSVGRLLAAAALVGLAACASVKAPILRVDGLRLGKPGITGASMEVTFALRNPNPEAMLVERFDYELFVNDQRLGRGFQPAAVDLPGFGEQRVTSRFDLNFFSLPGAVKAVLADDRAQARVKGDFFVRQQGGGSKKLGFEADAEVDITKLP
jgi:LEA14-like dessication related protein